MTVDYAAVLVANHPGAEWSIGSTYASLDWKGPGAKPTKASLDAAWPTVQHALAVAGIRAERHHRYLNETDPLFMKAQRDQEDGVTMADWKAAVAAIKADLPYPEPPAGDS